MSHYINHQLLEHIYETLLDDGCDPDLAAELAYKEFEQLPEADISEQEEGE